MLLVSFMQDTLFQVKFLFQGTSVLSQIPSHLALQYLQITFSNSKQQPKQLVHQSTKFVSNPLDLAMLPSPHQALSYLSHFSQILSFLKDLSINRLLGAVLVTVNNFFWIIFMNFHTFHPLNKFSENFYTPVVTNLSQLTSIKIDA